jgi:hypothetical protein
MEILGVDIGDQGSKAGETDQALLARHRLKSGWCQAAPGGRNCCGVLPGT